MIHKVFRLNGTPDLKRWVVECDFCPSQRSLEGSIDWLIPVDPRMPMYCPACLNLTAAYLIKGIQEKD